MNILNHNKKNSCPVGFFDSGVGGLSVYSRFKRVLPKENTFYFGDTVHLPYGSKSKEELVGYARQILNFYNTKGVKAVVIACNTSSAQAYEVVKDEYSFKIYPIIQSCAKIIAESDAKKIGVFATEATVKSGVYAKELKKYNPELEVFEIACPQWVQIVESGDYDNEDAKNNIKSELDKMLCFNPDKIVLGCTHYPYLLKLLKEYSKKDIFIDPAEIFVEYIKNDLEKQNLINVSEENGSEMIFVSANPKSFVNNAKIFYNIKSEPIIVTK